MSVIVWKMNGDVFTKSFQNAILLKNSSKLKLQHPEAILCFYAKAAKAC